MNQTLKTFLLLTVTAGLAMLASARSLVDVANLPLWFETSSEPSDRPASFVAHGHNAEFSLSPTGVSFVLRKADGQSAQARMQFVGARLNARLSGQAELTGKVNYLIGNQPSLWRTAVPTFGQVQVDNLYPGIDVVYYGNQRQLEYDFNLAASVNPRTIALHFAGAQKLSVNSQGELVVQVSGGTLYQHRPEIYQLQNGLRHPISGGYQILPDQTVTFAVGQYDARLPLVIDPVLGYSTYFGGNSGEYANGLALGGDGSIYIAGSTMATVFSNGVPAGAYQTNFHGGGLTGDAFVAKFDSTGQHLLFLTYLGGTSDDGAEAVIVDSANQVYIAGFTDSPDFPTTTNLIANLSKVIHGQRIPILGSYPYDAFVAKLDSAGANLLYSGYLGGNQSDAADALAFDPATSNLFVAGYTFSTNFPCVNALQSHFACTNSFYYNCNGFISILSFASSNLACSTFLGGTNFDIIRGIAFTNGNLFVTGITASTNRYGFNTLPQTNTYTYFMGTNYVVTNFTSPSVLNTLQNSNNSAYYDAFVAAFAVSNSVSSGTSLLPLYSMYLGGESIDYGYAIAADGNANAYVVGLTLSTNFPYVFPNSTVVTNLSFIDTNGLVLAPATNAFLTQITWNSATTNAAIGYSLAFGGQGIDVANGVALDPQGNIYVVGTASSLNFPTTSNSIYGALLSTNSGGSDAFIVKFNTNSAFPLYSAYLGGNNNDFGNAVAVDSAGDAYVLGQTYSPNFPVFNAYYTNLTSSNSLFIAKILPTWPTQSLSLTRHSRTNLNVFWHPLSQGVHLESNTNLTSTNWITVTNLVGPTNGIFSYPLNPTNPAQFFRLHQY